MLAMIGYKETLSLEQDLLCPGTAALLCWVTQIFPIALQVQAPAGPGASGTQSYRRAVNRRIMGFPMFIGAPWKLLQQVIPQVHVSRCRTPTQGVLLHRREPRGRTRQRCTQDQRISPREACLYKWVNLGRCSTSGYQGWL